MPTLTNGTLTVSVAQVTRLDLTRPTGATARPALDVPAWLVVQGTAQPRRISLGLLCATPAEIDDLTDLYAQGLPVTLVLAGWTLRHLPVDELRISNAAQTPATPWHVDLTAVEVP